MFSRSIRGSFFVRGYSSARRVSVCTGTCFGCFRDSIIVPGGILVLALVFVVTGGEMRCSTVACLLLPFPQFDGQAPENAKGGSRLSVLAVCIHDAQKGVPP